MFRSLPSSRFKPHRYRPGRIGNWSGHLPFGADLIDALKPSLVVELGTHYGESYFGFCQAIQAQGLKCQAYAVDNWVGDVHTGEYGPHVFQEVSAYNAAHYEPFSTLLRTSFDEAIKCFGDGTIDLLHLDGCHTYEAIRHDYDTWLPKVRAGGVILLHDVAMREGDFGAWRFWEEVSPNYPSFAFHHDCGLGVLLKGAAAGLDIPLLAEMLDDPADPEGIRDYYVLCAERLQYAHEAAGEYATFGQVFSPDTTGYSNERSSTFAVSTGAEATVEFSLPSPIGPLRLDPCDCAGVIEIFDIVVESSSGAILWRLDPSEFHKIQSAGTSIRMPDESRLIFCSYGDDPQLYIPSLDSLNPAEAVRVRCRFRIDRGWQVVESLWRQVGTGLAHARKDAETHAQHEERLESELAQAASQAAHYKNLIEEQQRQRADAETRLRDATSHAAHYKNLLEEQQQQRADADTRLREATSQAAHYKNLLEEQQRQRADADTRLRDATSQAAHYKNLLEEQQRQRADAEARLGDATSQAAHHHNLLDEQRRRAEGAESALLERTTQLADAEDCVREGAATANRLEDQVRALGEALENVKQQLAQQKSACVTAEETGRRLEAELAQAASQAAHQKNLLEEQQRQRADAEARLRDATSEAAHLHNLLDEQRRRAEDAESALLERTTQLADAHSKLADAENFAREGAAMATRLEDQVRALSEALENVKQQLAQQKSACVTAEEEVRSLRTKLSRFPVRLFVR